jgi:hypothetical protein
MNLTKAQRGLLETGETEMLDDEFKKAVVEAFRAGNARMDRMEETMLENTATTEAGFSRTGELVEVLSAMKGGFKVLEWLATLGKIIVGIGAAVILVAKTMGWKWPGGPE